MNKLILEIKHLDIPDKWWWMIALGEREFPGKGSGVLPSFRSFNHGPAIWEPEELIGPNPLEKYHEECEVKIAKTTAGCSICGCKEYATRIDFARHTCLGCGQCYRSFRK